MIMIVLFTSVTTCFKVIQEKEVGSFGVRKTLTISMKSDGSEEYGTRCHSSNEQTISRYMMTYPSKHYTV